MSTRRSSLFVSAGLAVGVLVGAVVPAASPVFGVPSSEERESALWYARALEFDELQAAGFTGAGVKIAVIDDAINPDVPELQGAKISTHAVCSDPETGEPYPVVSDDPAVSGHGTDVTAMLVGNGVAGDGGPGARGIAPEAEILFYGTPVSADGEMELLDCDPIDPVVPADEWPHTLPRPDTFGRAVEMAVRDGADVISISMIGILTSADQWARPLALAERAGVPVIAGTPNPSDIGAVIEMETPYSANGVVAVGGADQDGSPIGDAESQVIGQGEPKGSYNMAFAAPGSNLLGVTNADGWGPGITQGTSFATPLVAGTVALGLQAHPDATAYQVLQAMMRTTGNGIPGEPIWNGMKIGYGYINPLALTSFDPTQLPDENPVFIEDVSDPRCLGVPSMETCSWAVAPTRAQMDAALAAVDAALAPSEEPGADEPSGSSGGPAAVLGVLGVLLWVVLGVVVLAVLAVAVIVPITVSRRRRREAAQVPQVYAPYPAQPYAPEPAQPPGPGYPVQPPGPGYPGQAWPPQAPPPEAGQQQNWQGSPETPPPSENGAER